MIIVFPFSQKDQELALKNVQWMNELGGCHGHQVLCCYEKRCNPETVEAIGQELLKGFDRVFRLVAEADIDGWPEGANYMFRLCTAWLQGKAGWPYFMWMEPDAVFLVPGVLDTLEAEYKRAGKPFMGDRVEVNDIPLHMSGVGIYPNPIYLHAGEAYRAHDTAWDIAAKDQINPNAHWTKLIEHAWRHPTFHDLYELNTQIRKEAILFHSSKDGSLIDLLRQKYANENMLQVQKRTTDKPISSADHQGTVVLATMPNLREQDQSRVSSTDKDMAGIKDGAAESSKAGFGMGIKDRQDQETELVSAMQNRGEGSRASSGFQQQTGSNLVVPQMSSTGTRTDSSLIYDIFIRTYPGDYDWLRYCLRSIQKFIKGFRKVWIISPVRPPEWMLEPPIEVEWKVMNDETEDGYLAQQITKLYADTITNYQADYILHVDSDVIFTRPTTPEDFFRDDKLIWYYTPYDQIQTPWKPVTEKFIGRNMSYEFMRRLPMMVPRWLYPRLREFCHRRHGQIITEYVRMQLLREFSEFNALGAYAHITHPDKFHWVNTTQVDMPEPFARQFHSWSGITPEVKAEIETILGGGDATCSEKEKLTSAASSAPPTVPSASGAIKILPNDIWVLHGDQISQWIEQEGRLDHDQNLLPDILRHIKPGDTVVDCGAFIGDHTIAYSAAVGETGAVHAFEPNPVAFTCLSHNLLSTHARLYAAGLSNEVGTVPLSGNNGNWGGAYVGEHMPVANVMMRRLDDYPEIHPDFIKIDVEGSEVRVLNGAEKIITRYRPKMVIEINREALRRQGATPDEIFGWLTQHNYDWSIIQENALRNDPLYDILAVANQPSENVLDAPTTQPASAPVATLSLPETVINMVNRLKEISDESPGNKAIVTSRLSLAGLRTPVKKKWKKKKYDTDPFKKSTTTYRKRKQPAKEHSP